MNLERTLATLAEPAPPALADRVAAMLDLGDRYLTMDGPSGPLWIAFGRQGISFLNAGATEDEARRAYHARYPNRPLRPATAATAPPGLAAALGGSGGAGAHAERPRLTFDLSSCSPFQRAVLTKTAEIPRGEVRSYGWVAREIGHEGATRAVGTALGRNPVPVLIPCHRVVRSDGLIGNYALGSPVKRQLLTTEGVDLDTLARLATKGVRYLGSATTKIFCVPTCSAARRIRDENRVMFRSESQAEAAGYRPCKRCRPA